MRIVSEQEFSASIRAALQGVEVGSVTGPGRSGAVAAVYASHILGVPFIPYGQPAPVELGRVLVIDTAIESGATLRKAGRRYAVADPVVLAVYHEPPRVTFWYEAAKPQRYRHEEQPSLRPVMKRNRERSRRYDHEIRKASIDVGTDPRDC